MPRGTIQKLSILLGCLLTAAPTVEATQLRSLNLEELTGRADRIFAGRCIRIETGGHAIHGFAVARVTFEVERAVKGSLGATVTVSLLGAATDAPRFQLGERSVLFLYPDSVIGLTSPVGLGQGKFTLLRDKQGRELALNALGNRNLLRGLSVEACQRAGPRLLGWDGRQGLPPDTLLDGAQQLLGSGAEGGGR